MGPWMPDEAGYMYVAASDWPPVSGVYVSRACAYGVPVPCTRARSDPGLNYYHLKIDHLYVDAI